MSYVWCKKEERRLPAFRCVLCQDKCSFEQRADSETDSLVRMLKQSGKYKERYVMKRKEDNTPVGKTSATVEERQLKTNERAGVQSEEIKAQRVLLVEDGKVRPFSPEDYTASTLYQVVESFAVECRLARPEEPGNLIYEGKKPSKKTIPILIMKDGSSVLLESWESLESSANQLSEAVEVIGATPVKQVFVLKRK